MFSYLRSTTSTEMHRAPRDCKGVAAVIGSRHLAPSIVWAGSRRLPALLLASPRKSNFCPHRGENWTTANDEQLPAALAGVWIDRDLSWLDFNDRVLAEALDERTPLLERQVSRNLYLESRRVLHEARSPAKAGMDGRAARALAAIAGETPSHAAQAGGVLSQVGDLGAGGSRNLAPPLGRADRSATGRGGRVFRQQRLCRLSRH
jgi:hypothetical protein